MGKTKDDLANILDGLNKKFKNYKVAYFLDGSDSLLQTFESFYLQVQVY